MTAHLLDRLVPAKTVDSPAFRQWIPLGPQCRRVRRRLRPGSALDRSVIVHGGPRHQGAIARFSPSMP
jgi:hypothetical protein